MVECEYAIADDVYNAISVLIDTWWNVNIFPKPDKLACNSF